MDHLRGDFIPAQPNASNLSTFQQHSDDHAGARFSPRHDRVLQTDTHSRSNTALGFSWPADAMLNGAQNDLPPQYDSHQFPPTPPALHSSGLASESYFDQAHHGPTSDVAPEHLAWSQYEQPPRPFASRFPRWGTWLEKRALERHYAHLENQHLHQRTNPAQGAATSGRRKRSWGAWVDGPDAINTGDDLDFLSPERLLRSDAAGLPPLHLHHFGSRFIPHLPAQPLCSILVQLPPSKQHRQSQQSSDRQVLLIGTAQGLFALQMREPHTTFTEHQTRLSPSSTSSASREEWNDDIRCIQIWRGLAVYQLCVLASKDDPAARSGLSSQGTPVSTSGVFLALTCPSCARDGRLTTSLMQLSAHVNSVLESVASSGSFTSGSSSSSHNSHGISDANEGVAPANFGSTAGGGSGRAVPPSGTGVVRMWHLQAIRELLVYALDRKDAQIPIDLSAPSSSPTEKRGGFGTIFKKTFSRPRGKSDREGKRPLHERSDSNASLSAAISPFSKAESNVMPPLSTQQPLQSSSTEGETALDEQGTSRGAIQDSSRHSSRGRRSPKASPPSSRRHLDPAHAAAVALASSSVPILPPSNTSASAHSSNTSLSSLFADDLIQSFPGSRQAGIKGKERETGLQAASKGVLFFSVHEAAVDTKGSGTWYLAITYARSVMVYEAVMPKRGSPRAWSFVKELYAPFPIKAVAFAPAAVSDELYPFTGVGTLPASAGPTKLRVASPQGPLLASRKGTSRDNVNSTGFTHRNGRSSPVSATRTSAAPVSWHKADLCLMLSFGRRAVLVRLRDSDVRELDLKPLSQLIAVADGSENASPPQLSLQPFDPTDPHIKFDRTRPGSMVADGGAWTDGQMSSVSGHSRAGSMEQKLKDAVLDKKSSKHNWVGFSSIEAQIFVRQRSQSEAEGHDATDHNTPLWPASGGISPTGLSMAKNDSNLSPAAVDKDLPRAPAHQNASFDRRMSRMHLSEQSSQYHDEIQAESSSDSDEDSVDPVGRQGRAAKYQLTDPGPLPRTRSRANIAAGAHAQSITAKVPNRSSLLPPAELVVAKLALASRGGVTHVMPLPLAANLAQAAPLAVMQWSDTPNGVSGWARVLGVEGASSQGTTPLSHLKQSSAVSAFSETPNSLGESRAARPSLKAHRKNDRLVLHIGVTCVAFLASRIEARKVTFKTAVEIDFALLPNCELELIPLAPENEYSRANGAPFAPQDTPTGSEEPHYSLSNASTSFAYPAVATHQTGESSTISQELEYLCAPLLTLHPIDLDARSCGSQSLVLPFSQTHAYSKTAPHAMLPHLAGDGAVVAFDWRGANDFRIFTIGIAG